MGKDEIKLTVIVNDIILYIENCNESTQKYFEIINDSNFKFVSTFINFRSRMVVATTLS